MSDDQTTPLEAGDLVYLSFSFRDDFHAPNSREELVAEAIVHPKFIHPLRDTHALLLGRGSSPELEETLIGKSIDEPGLVEIGWLAEPGSDEKAEASLSAELPKIRAPAQTVDEALKENLATIAKLEGVRTPHEFIDLSAEEIADEYMLDAERIKQYQSEIADEIAGWFLAEYEVVEVIRYWDAVEKTETNVGGQNLVQETETSINSHKSDLENTTASVATAPSSKWAMFGGTPQLTGMTATTIPTKLPSPVWETSVSGRVSFSPIINDPGIVIVHDDGQVTALDPDTGGHKWSCGLTTKASAPPLSTTDVNHIYIGTEDGAITAIDEFGDIHWRHEGMDAAYHLAVGGNQLIVRTKGGALYAINRRDGQRVWTQTKFSDHGATLVSVADGLLTRSSGWLRMINPKTGTVQETAKGSGSAATPTGIGISEGVITANHEHLVSRSVSFSESGTPEISPPNWQTHVSDTVELAPAISSNHIITPTISGMVYGLDRRSGENKWSTNLRDTVRVSPVTDGETALIGSSNNAVYALKTLDGSVRWNINTEDSVVAPPAVADERIVVADASGNISVYQ